MNASLKLKSTRRRLYIVATICVCLPAGAAQAAKLYKWVDASGNISYQDQPPPSGSAVTQEVLKEGTVADPLPSTTEAAASDQANPVLVYTVPNCDTCEVLLLRLKQLGASHQELSLLDRDVQSRVLSLSDSLSAPTLFIGDKLISDISLDNLISELTSAGYQLPPRFLDDPDELPQNDTDDSVVDQ